MGASRYGVFDYCIIGIEIAGNKVAIVTLCGGNKAHTALDLTHNIKIRGHIFDALRVGDNDYHISGKVAFQNGNAQRFFKQGVYLYGHRRAGGEIKHKSVVVSFNAKLTAL